MSPDNVAFFCRCRDGFLGSRCQFPDPCVNLPCFNGGTCRAESRGNTVDYKCRCTPGWSGNTNRGGDELQDVALIFNIFSAEEKSTKTEILYKLYDSLPSGKLCNQADPCSSNPCANGGQCSTIDFQYICTCTPFFSGKTCKQDVNECDARPSPCRNGGACINEVGGYRCQCPQEFTGKHCESRYQPCSPSPCLNGGTCIQRGETSYECSCVPGGGLQSAPGGLQVHTSWS